MVNFILIIIFIIIYTPIIRWGYDDDDDDDYDDYDDDESGD